MHVWLESKLDRPLNFSESLFLYYVGWLHYIFSRFSPRFKDCYNSFLYSLSIALRNVRWLSITFISSNNFEILVGGRTWDLAWFDIHKSFSLWLMIALSL